MSSRRRHQQDAEAAVPSGKPRYGAAARQDSACCSLWTSLSSMQQCLLLVCALLTFLVAMVAAAPYLRSTQLRKLPPGLERFTELEAVHGAVGGAGGGMKEPPAPAPVETPVSGLADAEPTTDDTAASKAVTGIVDYEYARDHTMIVLTTANSMYQEWQKRTAVYTIKKLMPDFEMILLQTNVLPPADPAYVATNCSAPYYGCPVVESEDIQRTIQEGDEFIVYNRAYSMMKYMETFREEQKRGLHSGITNFILWEPDMLAIKPFAYVAPKGEPMGHAYFYMDPNAAITKKVLGGCTVNPEYFEPIGMPMAIHVDDLERVLPLWLQKTREVRTQPWGQDDSGNKSWIADMWGLACALCDLKIRAKKGHPAPEPPMDPDFPEDSWGIHYTFHTKVQNPQTGKTYMFEKREWTHEWPKPRPFGPIYHPEASKLQALFADTMDEALVAVFGPTTEKRPGHEDDGA